MSEDVFGVMERLIQRALTEAWQAGQRGDPTPNAKAANKVAWDLLSLGSKAVSSVNRG